MQGFHCPQVIHWYIFNFLSFLSLSLAGVVYASYNLGISEFKCELLYLITLKKRKNCSTYLCKHFWTLFFCRCLYLMSHCCCFHRWIFYPWANIMCLICVAWSRALVCDIWFCTPLWRTSFLWLLSCGSEMTSDQDPVQMSKIKVQTREKGPRGVVKNLPSKAPYGSEMSCVHSLLPVELFVMNWEMVEIQTLNQNQKVIIWQISLGFHWHILSIRTICYPVLICRVITVQLPFKPWCFIPCSLFCIIYFILVIWSSALQMDSWLGNRKRILVLNREDMISTADRNAWATYFAKQGTKVVFSNGQLGMVHRTSFSLGQSTNRWITVIIMHLILFQTAGHNETK